MRETEPDRPPDRDSAYDRFSRQVAGSVSLGPNWPWVLAVLLATFIAAWPAISQPGLLNTRGGGDSPFLLQRLHQLVTALGDGHFPVRWMPDANYGYGYPFYNYYAPLSIYIAAAFRLLGFSFIRAIHLAHLVGFAVAGLGMFYLGRRWLGSRWAGLLVAVAYTTAPFHMVNVYVRGDSLAEFWAMAFYPLVLLAADRLVEAIVGRGQPSGDDRPESTDNARHSPSLLRSVALFALAYAALILSHNISALIFSPFLLLYLLVRLAGERASEPPRPVARLLWPVISGLLLAFALAAWFFVPALAEQHLAQLGPVTEGYFHYSNHFRGLDLVQSGLLFDYNPDGGIAFRLGLIQTGLALAGAVAWWMSRKRTANGARPADNNSRMGEGKKGSSDNLKPQFFSLASRHRLFVILGVLIAVFMITPLSRPLWDHLPLLSFTQFPWRFLSVASFFLALLAGGLVLVTDRPVGRAAIALAGSLILLAAAVLGLRVDHLRLTDADVTAERLAQYEWFTGNIGTTVSAEYLTPDSSPRPWVSFWLNGANRDRAFALTGELSAHLVERTSTAQTWQVSAGTGGGDALFPTMFWSGWRASVDGQAADLRANPSSGLMVLTVPEGEHMVRLQLGRTPARLVAELLSVAAVIVALFMMVSRRGPAIDPQPRMVTNPAGEQMVEGGRQHAGTAGPLVQRWLLALFAIGGALLLAAFLWRGDPKELPAGDQTWDFAQMGYLHHSPGGIAFSDGARLFEYGFSANAISAGETLTITLSITPGSGETASLALVTPISARPSLAAEPPVLATQTVSLDREPAVFTLPIPSDAPSGLYVPRLILDGAQPLMDSGGTRGDLFLRPVRVEAATGNEAAEPRDNEQDVEEQIEVQTTSLGLRDAATLDGRFVWHTNRPIGGRYQVSWRLQNGDGLVLSQLDTQPGYGFNPTDGWLPGEPMYDWLAMTLPETLEGPPPYSLVMLLYDPTTGEQLLARRLGEVVEEDGFIVVREVEPVFAVPPDINEAAVTFAEAERPLIRLRGYSASQTTDAVNLSFYWEAMDSIPADYTRFVHLLDSSGAVVAQIDGHPVGNSYPTGQWTENEVIEDTLRFDLTTLSPGEYHVAVGFYQPVEGLPRLEAIVPESVLPDGRFVMPETIVVPPR